MILTKKKVKNETRAVSRISATVLILILKIYQLPILTRENMIAGILGSPAGVVSIRPQP
jgi:hypothetical protein